MKYQFVLIFVIAISITGCATYSQYFINSSGSTAFCSSTGQGVAGMATASNATNDCIQGMESEGYLEIERAGTIGVEFSSSKNDSGVRIIRVADNSPAQVAGIVAGAILKNVNGQYVNNAEDARLLLFGIRGTDVKITVMQDGTEKQFNLTRASYVGIYGTGSGTRSNADILGIKCDGHGVITDIDKSSSGYKDGLRMGDKIEEFNGSTFFNISDIDMNTTTILKVHRNGEDMHITLKPSH